MSNLKKPGKRKSVGKRQQLGGVKSLFLSPNIEPLEATLWSTSAREELLPTIAVASTITHVARIEIQGSLQISDNEWSWRQIVNSRSLMDLISNSVTKKLGLPTEQKQKIML